MNNTELHDAVEKALDENHTPLRQLERKLIQSRFLIVDTNMSMNRAVDKSLVRVRWCLIGALMALIRHKGF